MVIPDLSDPQIWMAFLTLTFLEIVLGIDNIIFISIASNKLPREQRGKAEKIGLLLAMAFRIILLFGISYLIAMQSTLFTIDTAAFEGHFTGQGLILIAGGIFLLYKSTSEIHHKLEQKDDIDKELPKKISLTNVIIQIALINIVFSFDSILTAIGMTDNLLIMITAVVLSIVIMMIYARPVGRFVNKHPTIQILGMAFLLLIGFLLIAEGSHLSHVEVAGQEVGTVPKGYLYFAIAFSLLVEFLNIRFRKSRQPVELHGYGEDAEEKGLL